jgi:hypothetical protein
MLVQRRGINCYLLLFACLLQTSTSAKSPRYAIRASATATICLEITSAGARKELMAMQRSAAVASPGPPQVR